MRRIAAFARAAALLFVAAPVACLGSTDPGDFPLPEFTDADLRVLYVGNSLTYTNNLPGVVRALAVADGRTVSDIAYAAPDFSLEDHWRTGIASEIRRLEPDVVVMQQGPSSLPQNKAHLNFWSAQIAAVAREVGAAPTLFMVWPEATRQSAFLDVADSYAAAAAFNSALLAPAGGTWLKAWELEPTLQFYGADGFHPSYLGTLAAAHAMYAVLFEVDPASIPGLSDGVPASVLQTLRAALTESLATNWVIAASGDPVTQMRSRNSRR